MMALPTIWGTRRKCFALGLTVCLTVCIVMYRRPILALIMMVARPGEYDHSPHDHYRTGLSGWDFSRLELQADHQAAMRIANRILAVEQLTLENVRAFLDNITEDYLDASQQTIDLGCLRIFL